LARPITGAGRMAEAVPLLETTLAAPRAAARPRAPGHARFPQRTWAAALRPEPGLVTDAMTLHEQNLAPTWSGCSALTTRPTLTSRGNLAAAYSRADRLPEFDRPARAESG